MAPPVERVWIEKDDGKQRPIGKPCFEDKIVQRAGVMMLAAIFEPELHGFSHGFRKGHRQHQALHELREFIQQRGRDGGIWRLLGQWLHAGVREAGALRYPAKGPPPGGVSSPMGSNVFLQRVLDEWFVKDGQPRMQGQGFLTRFADDCIIGCALEADARRVMDVLPKRVARFRLTIQPEKTAFIAFQRPPSREPSARGTGRFALLGLTHYGAKTRRGYWGIKPNTGGKRRRRFRRAIWTWCRDNRHAPWQAQYQRVCLKRRGDYPYSGMRGNCKRLEVVFEPTERAWRSWLSRRSHTGHIRWQKFVESVHRQRPLPTPRIMHDI